MKLKKKVQTKLEWGSIIGLFILGGFVEERPLIAFIGLLVFIVPVYLLARYGVLYYE